MSDPGFDPDRMPSAPPLNDADDSATKKPGVIPLRPLQVGEILGGAVATIRTHPALILGVSAAVAVVNSAVGLAVALATLDDLRAWVEAVRQQANTPNPNIPFLDSSVLISGLASTLVTLLITAYLAGFLTVVVGRAVLGKHISYREAFAELKPRLLPLFGLTLIYVGIVFIGALFFLIPGIWLYALFGLATPAFILERGQVGDALRRSKDLVRGSWWRVFGVLLLTVIIGWIVLNVLMLPVDAGSSDLGGLVSAEVQIPTNADLFVHALVTLVATTFTAPFAAAVTALLYIDQRMRKEDLAAELLRAR